MSKILLNTSHYATDNCELCKANKRIAELEKKRDELLPIAYPPCPECGCEDRNESDMTLKCECPEPLKGK